MKTTHTFQESLNKSKALEDSDGWLRLYKKFFPNLATEVPMKEDGWAQRGGIDRILLLSDGTYLKVEEKIRHTDYGDFLFEYRSSKEHRTPGWAEKDLVCDYLAYVVLPAQKCYLLPYQIIRRAWRENRDAWIAQYRRVPAQNDGYTTVSVAVPKEEVWKALREAMVVKWEEAPFANLSFPSEEGGPSVQSLDATTPEEEHQYDF